MRILVTGASGLLGLNFCISLMDEENVTGVLHVQKLQNAPFPSFECDLLSNHSFEKLISKNKPDLLIHCAAMANVDACETHPDEALRVNAELPGSLAEKCASKGIRLLHISTDAVFDGMSGDYSEEDKPNPLSVYASTKLKGEYEVALHYPQALIARVNFYGFSLSGKRSLAEFFLNNLKAGKSVNGFVDVMFCPLYVNDLVKTLMAMIAKDLSGLYHVVSPEKLSKYAFGVKIAEKFELDKSLIQPKSVTEGGLVAVRSPNLSLKIDKLKSAEITPPGQKTCMEHFYRDHQAKLHEKIMAMS